MDDDDDAKGGEGVDETSDDNQTIFGRFELDGARFNGGRLPVDALVELQRYRELVLEAAKKAWLRANPGEGIPDDFASSFDLAVKDIEVGSAIPVLETTQSPYDSFYESGRLDFETLFADIINRNFGVEELKSPGDETEELDQSDEPSEAGETAPATGEDPEVGHDAEASNREVSRQLRLDLLAHLSMLDAFRNFGSSLQTEDALVLEGAETHEQVRITSETASTVFVPISEHFQLEMSGPAEEAPVKRRYESTVAGRLVGLNADKTNFRIKTLHFGEVGGRYSDPEKLADLKAVLESSSQAPLVRVTGRMSWRDDRLYRILDVDEVELLEIETEPWSRRIVELASLAPSWHPEIENSPVISFAAIDAAREVLRSAQGVEIVPGIYPGDDGGVIVEWGSPQRVVTLEISPELDFYLFHLDVASGNAIESDTSDLSEVIALVGEALS